MCEDSIIDQNDREQMHYSWKGDHMFSIKETKTTSTIFISEF